MSRAELSRWCFHQRRTLGEAARLRRAGLLCAASAARAHLAPGLKGPREKLEPQWATERGRREGETRTGEGQERALPLHQALAP